MQFKQYLEPYEIEQARKIRRKGGRLYIVGGFVRDVLLGRPDQDRDYCVTGLTTDQFEELFPGAEVVGKSFPVYLIEGREYAFARRETKVAPGYKGFDIEANPRVSLKQDLQRRDLTVNAMAIDILNGKLIDPFQGYRDLQLGVLRHISTAFSEDPLRAYRVARFAARLEFKVDDDTLTLMKKLRGELDTLPAERVFEELKKALSASAPAKFFRILKRTGLLDVHFQEIDDLWGVPQLKEYHPEYYVHRHVMQSLQASVNLTTKNNVRFSVLMHDCGKGVTESSNWPHHYQHSKLGIKALDNLDRRLTLPKKWYRSARLAIREHMRAARWREMKPGKVVQLYERVRNSPLTIEDLIIIIKADYLGRGSRQVDFQFLEGFQELYHRMYRETSGHDLDQEQYSGREFGERLFEYRCQWFKRERSRILR